MTESGEIIAFVRAQLDEDERWAREASRAYDQYTASGEHWRWVCETTDTPVDIDPVTSEYVEGLGRSSVGLRSVEQYESRSGIGLLPHLVIGGQDELEATVAVHIARHDPARALAEADAKRQLLDEYEATLEPDEEDANDPQWWGYRSGLEYAVRLLTQPHAARDGYRPEWAPNDGPRPT